MNLDEKVRITSVSETPGVGVIVAGFLLPQMVISKLFMKMLVKREKTALRCFLPSSYGYIYV